jgi:hypothetical protein
MTSVKDFIKNNKDKRKSAKLQKPSEVKVVIEEVIAQVKENDLQKTKITKPKKGGKK